MLVAGQDFDCNPDPPLCSARRTDEEVLFVQLQQTLAALLPTLGAPVPAALTNLPSDGRITATTALAVQTVLGMLAQRLAVPGILTPVTSTSAPPMMIVQAVAALTPELLAYLGTASATPSHGIVANPEPVLKVIGYSALGLLLIGGVFAIAYSSTMRSTGQVDQGRFLPPPLPGEVDDDDSDDDDDGDEEPEEDVHDAVRRAAAEAGSILPASF